MGEDSSPFVVGCLDCGSTRGRHGQIGEQHVYTPRRPHDCSGQIQFEEWSIISDDVGAELGKNLAQRRPHEGASLGNETTLSGEIVDVHEIPRVAVRTLAETRGSLV